MRVMLAFLLSLIALSAQAWVPAQAPSGCIERWYTADPSAPNITVSTDNAGIGAIPASDVHAALLSAMKTWTSAQCGLCANPGGPGCAPQICATNSLGITLQDGGISPHTPWLCLEKNPDGSCKINPPNGNYVLAVTKPSEWLWSQYTASQTLVMSNNATGEIVDADILINLAPHDNGTTFAFCQGDCAAKPGAYPLCIVLTHELGHLLGLNHSLDTKATMATSAIPSDLYKCGLSADDTLGICTIYRETCSGIPAELSLTTAQCEERAKANTPPDVATPAPSCQASARVASPWSILLLLALSRLVHFGWGRSRAKRT